MSETLSMPKQKDYFETIIGMLQANAADDRAHLLRLEKKIDENSALTNKVHEQAKTTNGRVNGHDTAIKSIWKAINSINQILSGSSSNPKLSILQKIDGKVWFIIALTILILVVAGVGPETIRQVKELI